MIRRIILNIHIYGGLLCFSYLIIFGLSVLNFNHPFTFGRSPASVTTWSQPRMLSALISTNGTRAPDSHETQRQNNEAILHALGSFAAPFTGADGDWVDADMYHAHFVRPGNEYGVDVYPSRASATITRRRTGFWALIRDLHGSHIAYANSRLASTWAGYTELCTFVVVVAGISGIYLWAGRQRERRAGMVLLGAAGVISLTLMLLVTFHR
jgi:hypothetical protein